LLRANRLSTAILANAADHGNASRVDGYTRRTGDPLA